MDPTLYLSILLGKLASKIVKLKGTGGTALPGLVSSTIFPDTLSKLSANLKQGAILVAGTNGKTTTSRVLSNILSEGAYSYIHNRSGSNLIRGLTSTLVEKADLNGNLDLDYALFEVDEFVMPLALEQVKTKVVVILNLFRDQLDRYGEIETIRSRWEQSVRQLGSDTFLILNADDPNVAHLGKHTKAKVIYFGVDDQSVSYKDNEQVLDATKCQECGSMLDFEYFYLSHMGSYKCPHADFERPSLDVRATDLKITSVQSTSFKLTLGENEIKVKTPLPGLYNVYNILAASAACAVLGLELDQIEKGLQELKPAFGRGESIEIEGKKIYLSLVKNPTGFNEVLRLLNQDKGAKNYLLLVNDLLADGTDVSWLWDVNFESINPKPKNIFFGGSRAKDIALRLKYANQLGEPVILESIEQALDSSLSKTKTGEILYIMPTYTAMLTLRKILTERGVVGHFWED